MVFWLQALGFCLVSSKRIETLMWSVGTPPALASQAAWRKANLPPHTDNNFLLLSSKHEIKLIQNLFVFRNYLKKENLFQSYLSVNIYISSLVMCFSLLSFSPFVAVTRALGSKVLYNTSC